MSQVLAQCQIDMIPRYTVRKVWIACDDQCQLIGRSVVVRNLVDDDMRKYRKTSNHSQIDMKGKRWTERQVKISPR